MKKVLIACGGSGGHIFPGVALAEALLEIERNCQIHIVTSDRYIDTEIFKELDFSYSVLNYNPFLYTINPIKILRFFIKLTQGTFRSLCILKREKPDCVVGLGGYVSGPIVLAARLMRKSVIVHEQNVLPSLTNKLSSLFANKICVTFDETKKYFRNKYITITGNPIRHNFLKETSPRFKRNAFTILTMGGSQGSSVLNRTFKDAIHLMDKNARSRLQILHIAGKKESGIIRKIYKKLGIKAKVWAFLDKMGDAYSIADLIVSRAGATALAEITAFGKPSILIPYPEKRIHQKENADFFSKSGASIVIEEKNLTPNYLKDNILSLMNDSNRLKLMSNQAKILSKPEAAHNLAKEVLNVGS